MNSNISLICPNRKLLSSKEATLWKANCPNWCLDRLGKAFWPTRNTCRQLESGRVKSQMPPSSPTSPWLVSCTSSLRSWSLICQFSTSAKPWPFSTDSIPLKLLLIATYSLRSTSAQMSSPCNRQLYSLFVACRRSWSITGRPNQRTQWFKWKIWCVARSRREAISARWPLRRAMGRRNDPWRKAVQPIRAWQTNRRPRIWLSRIMRPQWRQDLIRPWQAMTAVKGKNTRFTNIIWSPLECHSWEPNESRKFWFTQTRPLQIQHKTLL